MNQPINLTDMINVKLAYSAERQKVLAQNIASIDTPGYRAQDLKPLDFGNVMAAHTRKIQLAVTSDLHMNGMNGNRQNFMNTVPRNAFERTPTGSTDVVEEQMMKVSQNATDYQEAANLYKKIGNLFREALGLQTS